MLPLGTSDPEKPHVPIFASGDLVKKSRVVLIFGQSVQDLGIIAHRVIGGRGGVNQGSMVSIIQVLKSQASSPTDSAPPGIIIANPGQTWWWPEGKRALDPSSRHAVPMASAVNWGRFYNPKKNAIRENRSPAEHIQSIFEKVVPSMVDEKAMLDIIAVGDAADFAEVYLDQNWPKWSGRINCMAILGGFTNKDDLTNDSFKLFLREVSCERRTGHLSWCHPRFISRPRSRSFIGTVLLTRSSCIACTRLGPTSRGLELSGFRPRGQPESHWLHQLRLPGLQRRGCQYNGADAH